MILLIISLAFGQILPQLPPPADLNPPTQRPILIPLKSDTMAVELSAFSPFGVQVIARRDGSLISARTQISVKKRNDFFNGFSRYAALRASVVSSPLQLGIASRYYNFLTEEEKSYLDGNISGTWYNSFLFLQMDSKIFTSDIMEKKRSGASLQTGLFTELPWAKLMWVTDGFILPDGAGAITTLITQHQFGFMMITPEVQGYAFRDSANTMNYDIGAGLDVIAVLGNLALELEGKYKKADYVIFDSLFLHPITAQLKPNLRPYWVENGIRLGANYRGVELALDAKNAQGFFWQSEECANDKGICIALDRTEYLRLEGELGIRIEKKYVSNTLNASVFLIGDDTPWTPRWTFTDSLCLHFTSWGVFSKVEAGGKRISQALTDAPYLLVSTGLYYDREPFRVVLRADDLFDRRFQPWPGLADSGRRIGLRVSFFSTKW